MFARWLFWVPPFVVGMCMPREAPHTIHIQFQDIGKTESHIDSAFIFAIIVCEFVSIEKDRSAENPLENEHALLS